MFIVLLTFSSNKANAKEFMQGHKDWIQQGFADGVFLMVGSIKPQKGGAVLANACTEEELIKRVNADPFVSENVVSAKIMEIAPSQTNEQLAFLLNL